MQTVLEQGSIDKPLTFDVGLIQLSFIPVCSLNTCNISVKLCRGFQGRIQDLLQGGAKYTARVSAREILCATPTFDVIFKVVA